VEIAIDSDVEADLQDGSEATVEDVLEQAEEVLLEEAPVAFDEAPEADVEPDAEVPVVEVIAVPAEPEPAGPKKRRRAVSRPAGPPAG
jgi:hypothetical protein